MFKKLGLVLAVLALVLAISMPQAFAKYGLVKWDYGVYDEYGQPITDTVTVNAYTTGTTTAATVYSTEDAASQSQPWTITDGKVEFWSSATSLDIEVYTANRGSKFLLAVGADDTHRIILPTKKVGNQKFIPLLFGEFSDLTPTSITSATQPNLATQNSATCMEWADGEAANKASVNFRVPWDYLSSGYFRVWADESANTIVGGVNCTAIDFEVYVNKTSTAFDSAVTDQTPVALAGMGGSPEELTLTVTTDFASLTAGDLVTLRIWRDDTTYTGTAALEVYGAEFVYTAKQ